MNRMEYLKSIPSARERFLKRISVFTGKDGCWEWIGTRTRAGYGVLRNRIKTKYAHILSYEIHKGTISEGLEVCHSCDNPPCVNPNHLFLGTHQQNLQDASRKGRMHKGFKLKDSDVLEIIRLSNCGIKQDAIAAQFGIIQQCVSLIVTGKRHSRTTHVSTARLKEIRSPLNGVLKVGAC